VRNTNIADDDRQGSVANLAAPARPAAGFVGLLVASSFESAKRLASALVRELHQFGWCSQIEE
jgi:hypothetical protein